MLDVKWFGAVVAAAAALAAYAHYRNTRKRRVVITGGCGNLGTKLATRLLASGKWEVVRQPTSTSLSPLARSRQRLVWVEGQGLCSGESAG